MKFNFNVKTYFLKPIVNIQNISLFNFLSLNTFTEIIIISSKPAGKKIFNSIKEIGLESLKITTVVYAKD